MWNWSNICWWVHDGQSIFRVFMIVVEQDTKVSGYSWCQIFTESTKNEHIMYLFPVFVFFYQISLGGISWYMKPMPVIFLFSSSRDSFEKRTHL